MTVLEISQLVFNITATVLMMTLFIGGVFLAYRVYKTAQATKTFFEQMSKESKRLFERIDALLTSILGFRFLSWMFKGKSKDQKKV